MIFLIAGIPIWFYCTGENSKRIPTEFLEIIKQQQIGLEIGRENNEIPNFKKSEIKLKFIFMTREVQNLCNWRSEKFDKFLKLLKPEMSFKVTFSTKYYDKTEIQNSTSSEAVEEIIKSLRYRDERGREDIFNFIVIESTSEEMILIPNWGIINIMKGSDSKSYSIDKFLFGFSKLIGFKEIHSWKADLRQFYLKRSFEMISQLNGMRIPSIVYETKLKLAMDLLGNQNIKESFDLIDSAFHDPKLIAAAYFPDEHKFAIYLPVYLPLILPILMAFIKEIKERRVKKKKCKTE